MFGEYTYLFDFVNLQLSNDDTMQGYHRVSDTYPTLVASSTRMWKILLEATLNGFGRWCTQCFLAMIRTIMSFAPALQR